MRDRTWELVNSVLGYGGIGVFVLAVLLVFDGRVNFLRGVLIGLLGVVINTLAVVSELHRSDETRDWLRDVMTYVFIGEFEKAKKTLKGEEV